MKGNFSFIRFGLILGASVALILTLVCTAWEWIDNPGGIFRTDDGAQWDVLLETAVSWFVPAFLYSAPIAALGNLLWTKIQKRKDAAVVEK